jgi:hypothetical protein
MEETKKMQEL